MSARSAPRDTAELMARADALAGEALGDVAAALAHVAEVMVTPLDQVTRSWRDEVRRSWIEAGFFIERESDAAR